MADVTFPTFVLGLLGLVIIFLTVVGYLPPWFGYPIGGALAALYILILITIIKTVRQKPLAELVGSRGVVVEVNGNWALIKIDGVYWRAYCENCNIGDVVKVTSAEGHVTVRKV